MPRTPSIKTPVEFTDKNIGKRNINAQVNVSLYNAVRKLAESEGKTLTEVIAQLFTEYVKSKAKENLDETEKVTGLKFKQSND